jgi:hypothetical protein
MIRIRPRNATGVVFQARMTRCRHPAGMLAALISWVIPLACRDTPVTKLSDARVVGCWRIATPAGLSAKYGVDTVFREIELLPGSFTSQRPDIHRARLGIPTDSFTTAYWRLGSDSAEAVVVYSWVYGGLSLAVGPRGTSRDTLDGVVRFGSETVHESLGVVGLTRMTCRADGAQLNGQGHR